MITVYYNDLILGGCGSDYIISESNIVGLGVPDIKPRDLELVNRHGIISSGDFLGQRTINIPIIIYRKNSPEDALAALETFKRNWLPIYTGTQENYLVVETAGINPLGSVGFYGRPRGGLEVDLGRLHSGLISVFATFVCTDPLGYTSGTAGTGTSFTVTNDGNMPTERIFMVLTGNGGVPKIKNSTDSDKEIKFSVAVGAGEERYITVRNRTVVSPFFDAYSELSPTNQWFNLLPGPNSILVTGAASVALYFDSAWL